jgi:NTE family protein
MSDLSVASKFETDWRFLTKLRDMGREAASMWLNACFARVGHESTIDIRTDYL